MLGYVNVVAFFCGDFNDFDDRTNGGEAGASVKSKASATDFRGVFDYRGDGHVIGRLIIYS